MKAIRMFNAGNTGNFGKVSITSTHKGDYLLSVGNTLIAQKNGKGVQIVAASALTPFMKRVITALTK